jgi:retron-type reverse transcriptase
MQGKNNFDSMISHENLLQCWYKFNRGKNSRDDIHQYTAHLEENIAIIRHELQHQIYAPSPYTSFTILYPKKRLINKAVVKDRFVQYVIFDVVTKIYDSSLISHAYASRRGKGVHKGVTALQRMFYQVTNNNKRPCYFLKCDVQKFFDSVNQDILLAILAKRIGDERMLTLLRTILYSYTSPLSNPLSTSDHVGFPIGNVTSQVFSNIYMNELDQYVKHVLKMRYYLRYTDDCLFISRSVNDLQACLPKVQHRDSYRKSASKKASRGIRRLECSYRGLYEICRYR